MLEKTNSDKILTKMTLKTITAREIAALETRYRAMFINCLSGFKSVNLVGTADKNGKTNLAIVNSVIHLGANPPLMGFILRPDTVTRDTWDNILETEYYTFNHLNSQIIEKAHQTSARYPKEVSEFDATGLTPIFSENFAAPFVLESFVKIGLKFRERLPIELNGTYLVIGEIIEIQFPENCLSNDGFLDIQLAGSATNSGLDAYHLVEKPTRLSYAKTDKWPSKIS
jgi:flavin reductase (DIM6/NTAB) family NADH-FMN oxidoreductase RutF